MRYGMPYKGSKNTIAKWIVDELPSAECFVDLFCGGCAVTHRALLSNKYDKFIINDIDARLPDLFIDCCNGKYTIDNHKEWISREEFNNRKYDDAYIALVWSFGNNGKDYLYGEDIEEMKKAFHYAVFFNDYSLFNNLGVDVIRANAKMPLYDRYLFIKHQFDESQYRDIRIESLQRLQRLQRLQSLQSLQRFGGDYQLVPIPNDSVIYCDIPYASTNCGKYQGFDHKQFYEWAMDKDNIFISEYWMPDDFIEIANIQKQIKSTSNGNSVFATEKIFTNKKTLANYPQIKEKMH